MGTAAPNLVLSIIYWLHMLATITWIGGLAALALLVQPAAQKALPAEIYRAFFARLQPRISQVGWFSLAILIVTGMFQMSASPFYKGFLAIQNSWSVAIFAKHIMIGAMILVSIYQTWFLTPSLQRLSLRQTAGLEISRDEQSRLSRRETLLYRLNLAIAVIILALTALARVA
jgi:putative copper resistance protein D